MSDTLTLKYLQTWQAQKDNSKLISKLHKQVSNQKVTAEKAQNIHDEIFDKMDCLQCANCCKSIPPIVSKRDIKRIAIHLNLSPGQFEEKYTLLDEDGDRVINASPCPFLEENNACRIYEQRPHACRAYPHSGNFEFKKNINLHKRNAKYCPALFQILKRLAIA